jgi:hypothetical protein
MLTRRMKCRVRGAKRVKITAMEPGNAVAMAGETHIIQAVVRKGVDGYMMMVWLRSDEAKVLLADRTVVNLTQAKFVADGYAKALRIPLSRVRLEHR